MFNFVHRLLLGFALTAAMAGSAYATTTHISDASYTVSDSGAVNITQFSVAQSGTLTVQLTDIPWPQSLGGISFLLTTATGAVLGKMSAFGTETFNVTAGQTLYALSYGVAKDLPGLTFGFGSYAVKLDYVSGAAVPLPASVLLLLSGLVVFVTNRRRRDAGVHAVTGAMA